MAIAIAVTMGAWALLQAEPRLEIEAFARGTAALAGFFSGRTIGHVAAGWILTGQGRPVVVTAACSATGYFLIVAALIGWRLARQRRGIGVVAGATLPMAFGLAILVNAVRVVSVVQAHRWIIPRFPDSYGAFLHQLTGLAVFLPALIALNLLLEFYGRSHSRADR